MATLAIDPQYTNKNAPKRVAEFSEKVRSIENFGLEKGDRFIIPINYEIWEKDLNGTTVQYIEVPILNAIPDGIVKHLYPSVFRKRRTIYNEDGTSSGIRVWTDGSDAELFRQFRFMREGINALRGKTLIVSDIKYIRTLRYGTTSLMNAQIPTIDIVR